VTTTPAPTTPEALVERSVRAYRRGARAYERRHPEIFNDREQQRLARALASAVADVRSAAAARPCALDLGCGTGNLTRRLLEAGCDVLAADVSPDFLRIVERRYRGSGRVRTVRLSGVDLGGIEDASVDLVAAYSVLHHIPDYIGALDEMARVLRPGGIVFVDHEVTEAFWEPDGCVVAFRRALHEHALARPGLWNPTRRRWQRYLVPAKYVHRARRMLDKTYPFGVEGDIHVWAWDHIEWPLIEQRLDALGFDLLRREDYLVHSAEYPREVYDEWTGRCADMRLLVARKR
jgi:SAM-dependent methyltransferase